MQATNDIDVHISCCWVITIINIVIFVRKNPVLLLNMDDYRFFNAVWVGLAIDSIVHCKWHSSSVQTCKAS